MRTKHERAQPAPRRFSSVEAAPGHGICEPIGLDLEREALLSVSASAAGGRLHCDEACTDSATFDTELGALEFHVGDGRATGSIGGAGDESLADHSGGNYRG